MRIRCLVALGYLEVSELVSVRILETWGGRIELLDTGFLSVGAAIHWSWRSRDVRLKREQRSKKSPEGPANHPRAVQELEHISFITYELAYSYYLYKDTRHYTRRWDRTDNDFRIGFT